MSALLQSQDQEWQLRAPPAFPPPWAEAWGDDIYGLWAEFEVKNVVQRMRWVEPGEFLMGSPESEAEREEDEGPQHLVRITQGFWLADTACTQELWQVLMKKNPSHFHAKNKGGLQHPVEQVSWLDVQGFLVKLSALLPEAQACLPTEAEWEYACRAGTRTPFSFGANITTRQVNYDGNYPYMDGQEGEYRGQTLAVKALPANAWGLYQMHGNVWEWCADALREYVAQAEDNPGLGPDSVRVDESSVRAVRGGCWFNYAQNARSAYRSGDQAGGADDGLGFRFALRSSSARQASQARQGLGF